MTHRFTSSSFVCALALSTIGTFSSANAQATAPAVAPTTPVAPTAPVAPAATPTPVEPTAPVERPATYTIEQGDSLWTVAHKYGTTVVKLRKLNGLKKGALLHPGQVIKLPPNDETAK